MAPRWSTRATTGDGMTEGHACLAPGSWKISAAAKRGAVYCHGRLGTHTDALGVATNATFCNSIVDAGIPVLSIDAGGTTAWGNDTAIARVGDAVAALNTNFGAKSDKVLLVGYSMGCPAVLNWARTHTASVAAVVLILPAVDVADIHDNVRFAGADTEINTAYGGAAAWTSAAATHSPAAFASTFAGIPMSLYYSTDDTIALSSVVATFVTNVGGAAASSTSIGANGHGIGAWTGQAAADFLFPFA